jgi:siroheme synthase-like protein
MSTNPLYPIFLKLHQLNLLIVGAGNVGFEKLFFILKSSPDANITLVAKEISNEIVELLSSQKYKVKIIQKEFEDSDVEGFDLVIAATDIKALNLKIHAAAKANGILINVADTPDRCDFYLGSIVTKGNLKVAISTNGQSPTFAKRFRQVLEEVLPEDVTYLIDNLKTIRDRLTSNFTQKVKQLNEITESLIHHNPQATEKKERGKKIKKEIKPQTTNHLTH